MGFDPDWIRPTIEGVRKLIQPLEVNALITIG
jgi:hypothetical protein